MISMTDYQTRRKQIMGQIGQGNIAILPSAKEILRNGDAVFPFRQNSDFYYLTGFNEPDAILVLIPERAEGEYILFNRIRDRDREIWDGPRAGQEGACQYFLADQAFPIQQFTEMLPRLLSGKECVYYSIACDKKFDQLIFDAINQIRTKIRGGLKAPEKLADIGSMLHEMRLFKSPAEINIMQKAIDITQEAHVEAMKACAVGRYEYELEAILNFTFCRYGARHAYGPIVGAGKNSCILHYVFNNKSIDEGDVVLIDAGAELENYAADITRTFPANGKFSAEQRAIYDVVLAAQTAAIESVGPSTIWTAAQDVIVKILTQGLIDLNILKGNVGDLIEQQAYLPFYMHRSGHWLGLDVHDVGQYRINNQWRTMEPQMVFTIEPGLYISADIPNVHERWHNIGVRIEDNVLVTETGHQILCGHIPKKPDDIEAIMGQSG